MWCWMIAKAALNVMPISTNHTLRSFKTLIFDISNCSLYKWFYQEIHSNIVNGNAVTMSHLSLRFESFNLKTTNIFHLNYMSHGQIQFWTLIQLSAPKIQKNNNNNNNNTDIPGRTNMPKAFYYRTFDDNKLNIFHSFENHNWNFSKQFQPMLHRNWNGKN